MQGEGGGCRVQGAVFRVQGEGGHGWGVRVSMTVKVKNMVSAGVGGCTVQATGCSVSGAG